jgi:hypothetical protein
MRGLPLPRKAYDSDEDDDTVSPFADTAPHVILTPASSAAPAPDDEEDSGVDDEDEDEKEEPAPLPLKDDQSHASIMSAISQKSSDDKVLEKNTDGHKSKVVSFRVCPKPNSNLYASAEKYGIIKFWRVSGGKVTPMWQCEIPKVPHTKTSTALAVQFSATGDWCFVGGAVDAEEKYGILYAFPIQDGASGAVAKAPLIVKSGDDNGEGQTVEFSSLTTLTVAPRGSNIIAGDANGHLVWFHLDMDKSELRVKKSQTMHITDRINGVCICAQRGKSGDGKQVIFAASKMELFAVSYKNMTRIKKGDKVKVYRILRDSTDNLEVRQLCAVPPLNSEFIVASRKLVKYHFMISEAKGKKKAAASPIVIEKDKAFRPIGLPMDWVSQIDPSKDGRVLCLSYDDTQTPSMDGAVLYEDMGTKKWVGQKYSSTAKLGEVAFIAAPMSDDKTARAVVCYQPYKKKGKARKPQECSVRMKKFDKMISGLGYK